MNITRKWKRFLLCSCSHGHLADPAATKALLDFKRKWKPALTWHLGDAFDLAALRSGAKGTADEADSIVSDFGAGIDFLKALEPQKFFYGNHEDRLPHLAESPNAVVSYACSQIMGEIQDVCAELKAEVISYDIEDGWRPFGDALAGHGFMYSTHALAQHAQTFGKCFIGHLHYVGQMGGMRPGAPVAYCVGTLSKIKAMAYARRRPAVLRWSQGWYWGEYCANECVAWPMERTRSGEWRTPF